MFPWTIRRRSASGVMSTISTCSAARDDLVGDRLALLDPGDPLDDVVERFEVLDVERRRDVDAGGEQLLDVLPALLVATARNVGVGELVDEHPLGAAGDDRVDVHLLERRVTVVDRPPRHDLEVTDRLGGQRPVVRLDKADHDVAPAFAGSPALVEHGERLADARRGAEVDAQVAALHVAIMPLPRRLHDRWVFS